jgi:hypothetical protein
LLNEPNSDLTWAIWATHHYQDHVEINQALQAQGKGSFVTYPLDPIPNGDKTQWLEWHQIMHSNMTQGANIQSRDLQDVDLSTPEQVKSWIFLNFQDHYSVRSVLKI